MKLRWKGSLGLMLMEISGLLLRYLLKKEERACRGLFGWGVEILKEVLVPLRRNLHLESDVRVSRFCLLVVKGFLAHRDFRLQRYAELFCVSGHRVQ